MSPLNPPAKGGKPFRLKLYMAVFSCEHANSLSFIPGSHSLFCQFHIE